MKTSTHQPLCLLRPDTRIKTSTLKIQSKSACPSFSLETRPSASWGQATVMSTEARSCCSRTCRGQQHVMGMEGTALLETIQCMGHGVD